VLVEDDRRFLDGSGYRYDVVPEDGMTCVVLHDVRLPPGFDRETTDLLVRLPPAYPDAQPDMFWCDPPLKLGSTGIEPIGTDIRENFVGRAWQRFSRHIAPGAWRPGQDNLQSWVRLIVEDLSRTATGGPRP
jgi:hypothetical protein